MDESLGETHVLGTDYRPLRGCLTDPRDTTVGGGGDYYAGIGNSVLPEELQKIGAAKRQELFPSK